MKAKELNNFTKDELLQKRKALKEELFKLNQQRFTGRVDKPHTMSLIKKDIARVETVLRKLGQQTKEE
ncbi:MAG: 50S ribosomal protein L29 [Candidatus Omnitrophota bacterium]|nr:MAG: 50S ribosomal protein L29 [Candidatus Omnitrophota bacterium]